MFKHSSEMLNAGVRRFTLRVSFVENNQIITASDIQKFNTHVTMNKLSANNVLKCLQGHSFNAHSFEIFQRFCVPQVSKF